MTEVEKLRAENATLTALVVEQTRIIEHQDLTLKLQDNGIQRQTEVMEKAQRLIDVQKFALGALAYMLHDLLGIPLPILAGLAGLTEFEIKAHAKSAGAKLEKELPHAD